MTRPDATYPHADVEPILTGEAVPLEIRSAGLGSRALAMLVDLLVQLLLLLVLQWTAMVVFGLLLGSAADGALFAATGIGTLALVLVGYPTAMLSLAGGRTLGKMALGLRVLRDDGGPVGVRHAATRTLVGVAVEFPGVLLPFVGWVIGMVAMMASRHSRRIGDHAAGTIVIHERTHAWGFAPVMPAPLAAWAATLDLAGLDDDLALGIRQFLARNRQLREPDRTRLGLRLARQVAETVRVPAPPGTPGWAYLAAVHAERHGRAMRRLLAVRDHAAGVWPELLGPRAAVTPDVDVGRTAALRPATPTRGG